MSVPAADRRMPDWLARRAVDVPHRPAIIAGSGPDARRWTFAELDATVTALATRLAQHIEAGDRVAVALRNGPHHVAVVHALTRLGAIHVPLNLRLAPSEVAWQVEHAHAHLLLHEPDTAGLARAAAGIAGAVPVLELVGLPGDAEGPSNPRATPAGGGLPRSNRAGALPGAPNHGPPPDPGALRGHIDLAAAQCIMYTSGTTGRPKGAVLSYGNHWWSAMASALNLGMHDHDRWLVCLPLFHIGGLAILFRGVIYGIPLVFPDLPETGSGFDPAAVNRAILEHRVTIVSVVSIQLQRMLDLSDPALPAGGPLRCLLLGGGPAPRPLLEACAARGLVVVQSYGLTETASQVATLAPGDALRKLGSAGRPLLPNEIRIEMEDAAHSTGDRGEELPVGEILVRGPTVSPGYLGSDGDLPTLPATDTQGWLHTGDAGYLDPEGYLYVLDRRSDLIISGGENIYPAEVEAVLLAHPAIAEAGVYGVPDPRWGQAVAAAVVARPNVPIEEAEVLAFCRARLAHYKVPSQLRVVSSLPRNAAGKLLRRVLRE